MSVERFQYWLIAWKGIGRGSSPNDRPHMRNLGQGTVVMKML
jgi:hypothetical protein